MRKGNSNKKNEKKKSNFGKLLIPTIISLVLIYTIGVLWVFLKVGNEPSTLTTCFYAFMTGEVWALALIKINKIKGDDK